MGVNRFEREIFSVYIVPNWKLSIEMEFLNEIRHNNWDEKERQYFWVILGYLYVTHGIDGSHSVVIWQRVGLEDSRQLIRMAGALAGMSARLESVGTIHQSTYVFASHHGGHSRETSYMAAQVLRGKAEATISLVT